MKKGHWVCVVLCCTNISCMTINKMEPTKFYAPGETSVSMSVDYPQFYLPRANLEVRAGLWDGYDIALQANTWLLGGGAGLSVRKSFSPSLTLSIQNEVGQNMLFNLDPGQNNEEQRSNWTYSGGALLTYKEHSLTSGKPVVKYGGLELGLVVGDRIILPEAGVHGGFEYFVYPSIGLQGQLSLRASALSKVALTGSFGVNLYF